MPLPSVQPFGPIVREDQAGTVLVKDLSKSGIGILYHRQIFPGERFDILVLGRTIDVTAVRCRRIDALCYETGAIIHSVTSESAEE